MDYKDLYTQKKENPTIDVLIRKVNRQLWAEFQGYCRFEGTTATDKLKSLIAKYVDDQGKEKD